MSHLVIRLLCFSCWSMLISASTMTPSLLDRARSVVLPFHQRMLYAHAPPPRPDIATEINHIIFPTAATSDPGGEGASMSDEQRIFQALLYLGTGALDAAHDIVQRMSLHDAVYIHALVHRLEGKHAGEGGMKGWSNADYWNDQVGSYHPHYPLLCEYILRSSDLSPSTTTSTTTTTTTTTTLTTTPSPSITVRIRASIDNSDRVAKFVRQVDQASRSVPNLGSKQSGWQPSLFLSLCMDGFRHEDASCVAFCEGVTTYEYRLLLDAYCVKCLGVASGLTADGELTSTSASSS